MTSDKSDILVPRFEPIPHVFHSVYADGHFRDCVICGRDLLRADVRYMIEKAFVREETIFEYAMCEHCRDGMAEELSRVSSQRLQAHFEERCDWIARWQEMDALKSPRIDHWLDRCVLTKTPRRDCRSFSICGIFQGDQIVLCHFPAMLCDAAMSQVAPLLSKKTRERLDDFTDEYLGMPPELRQSPTGPELVFF